MLAQLLYNALIVELLTTFLFEILLQTHWSFVTKTFQKPGKSNFEPSISAVAAQFNYIGYIPGVPGRDFSQNPLKVREHLPKNFAETREMHLKTCVSAQLLRNAFGVIADVPHRDFSGNTLEVREHLPLNFA